MSLRLRLEESWPYLVFFVLAVHYFVLQFSETPIFGTLLKVLDPISKHRHSACEGVLLVGNLIVQCRSVSYFLAVRSED